MNTPILKDENLSSLIRAMEWIERARTQCDDPDAVGEVDALLVVLGDRAMTMTGDCTMQTN